MTPIAVSFSTTGLWNSTLQSCCGHQRWPREGHPLFHVQRFRQQENCNPHGDHAPDKLNKYGHLHTKKTAQSSSKSSRNNARTLNHAYRIHYAWSMIEPVNVPSEGYCSPRYHCKEAQPKVNPYWNGKPCHSCCACARYQEASTNHQHSRFSTKGVTDSAQSGSNKELDKRLCKASQSGEGAKDMLELWNFFLKVGKEWTGINSTRTSHIKIEVFNATNQSLLEASIEEKCLFLQHAIMESSALLLPHCHLCTAVMQQQSNYFTQFHAQQQKHNLQQPMRLKAWVGSLPNFNSISSISSVSRITTVSSSSSSSNSTARSRRLPAAATPLVRNVANVV